MVDAYDLVFQNIDRVDIHFNIVNLTILIFLIVALHLYSEVVVKSFLLFFREYYIINIHNENAKLETLHRFLAFVYSMMQNYIKEQ